MQKHRFFSSRSRARPAQGVPFDASSIDIAEGATGFDRVLRRVGRRVLIDEAAFFNWVNQSGGAE